jgi:hypothetical protein
MDSKLERSINNDSRIGLVLAGGGGNVVHP